MSKKNLLISEPPLQVLPSLAKAIGLNEAIVIQQIHYWLENPKSGVEKDGHKWVFNTYDEWQENFPFWSISTIQRTFSGLEESGLVIAAQFDKHNRDMRKYYRINYQQLDKMDNVNLTPSNHVKLTSPKTSNRHDVNSNTETTTETTTRGGLSEKQINQANQQVTDMIANSKKVKYQNRDKIPEPYLPFADLYNELTGQEPTKRVIMDWFQTFEDWKAEGLQPDHIRAAWKHANRPDGGFPVGRPGALTNTAVAMKSKNHKTDEERGEYNPYASLERYLERQ